MLQQMQREAAVNIYNEFTNQLWFGEMFGTEKATSQDVNQR